MAETNEEKRAKRVEQLTKTFEEAVECWRKCLKEDLKNSKHPCFVFEKPQLAVTFCITDVSHAVNPLDLLVDEVAEAHELLAEECPSVDEGALENKEGK